MNFLICFFFIAAFFATINGEGCGEDCECGISKNIGYYEEFNQNKNRILGGKNSDPQDWPFIVYLDGPGCTGSIINNQWILSAAHCDSNQLTVIINGESYKVEEFIAHENYTDGDDDDSNDTGLNDIMLVKLAEPLVFSENISSICLLQNLTVPPMEVAAAAGYGIRFIRVKTLNDTYKGSELSSNETIYEENNLLRETPLLIRDFEYCKINISTEGADTVICAGGANHGTTPGDSGGPLLVIRDHRWVQIGVTAFGDVMPVPGDLLAVSDIGFYTKISAFCDWIAEKTSNEVTCQ
uniref:Peptidase S1 domain-containing protein n=1 Tax=Panagrolaimus sp. ES5 TaxID=591445 RepID=A0AC34F7X1_9BILA